MPRLSPHTEARRAAVAFLIATELYRRSALWSRPLVPWHARREVTDPWVTGHQACQIRDWLVARELRRLGGQEPYRHWPELRSYGNNSGKYDLYRRIKWIWD